MLILIWIILLIVFAIYSVYKLSYSKFSNIITHLDTVNLNLNCDDIYDDNIAVRSLGYNNCNMATTDYIARNLDVSNKYGYSQSLSDICPVSTLSNKYISCMQSLLNKYDSTTSSISSISNDLTNILNDRLDARRLLLNNIETDIKPYLSKELFNTTVDPYIKSVFLSINKKLPQGQYKALDGLNIKMDVDSITFTSEGVVIRFQISTPKYYKQHKNIVIMHVQDVITQSPPLLTTRMNTIIKLFYTLGLGAGSDVIIMKTTDGFKLLNSMMNTIIII